MGSCFSKCDYQEDITRRGLNLARSGISGRMWWAWDLLFLLVLRIFFRIAHWVVHLFLTIVLRSKRRALPPPQDEILLKSATKLAEDIRHRRVKCEKVVETYISRMKEVQPFINAIIDERFDFALEEARKTDHYIASCGLLPQDLARTKPFLGVPITVKGSLACEGMDFSVGAVFRRNLKADYDAEVVCKMRQAGAIPVAMTNLPPLCVGFSSENPLFGVTWNPYDLRRLSGGSSGGEAALLAAGGSVLGLANDLGGSLRIPACLCGVFAHKPTSGVVSSEGFFTLVRNGAEDVLINGPMCRYAEDLLPALNVMVQDYCHPKLNLHRKVDLNSIKIYYTNQNIDNPGVKKVTEEVRDEMTKVINFFQSTHEAKVEEIHIPYLDYAIEMWQAKLEKSSLVTDSGRGYIEIVWELSKSFLGCSQETTLTLWHALNKKLFGKRRERMNPLYRQMAGEIEHLLRKVLEDDNSPAILLFPSSPDGAPYRMEEGLATYTVAYYMLFSALGLPVTQCPLGLNREHLPIGVQIVGGRNRDRVTIAVANEIEKEFGGWLPPWGEEEVKRKLSSSL